MSETQSGVTHLGDLEAQIDELIQQNKSLETENSALRNHQKNLVKERAALIEKTEQAKARIEAMISRLRTMETRP